MDKILAVGDRVRLSGGYDPEPAWLRERAVHFGTLREFIPGQNESLAAVIQLDEAISVDDVTGKTIVLELRYVEATWSITNTVHVELCDFVPEHKRWQDRKQGKWIESHATYERLAEATTTR